MVPCNDLVECAGHNTQVSATHYHAGHDKNDHCTPFCQCTCCNVVSIQQPANSAELFIHIPIIFSKRNYLEYVSATPKDLHSLVWQPPRFVMF